ncbi:MAG: MFS transporter [Anaerolineaceae bacterium]|nr:MFS transporter [Anaerolineaceae bacterium]
MKHSRYRWFVVGVFFLFMLLHQSDKLLIGPLTLNIIETFNITHTQMGAVFTGALLVGAFAYPLWGLLYDRFSRSKLLALASFLWGSTTWLSAIAPTYGLFMVSRASTGIDDSSYPGLYSLISDYFGPKVRGKIYGLLQLTQPLGYLVGMVLALLLGGAIGWRAVFYVTGSLGILLAVVIFFGIKDAPRGKSEPELADLEEVGIYRFDWKIAKGLFKKPSLVLLFTQGFFGVFPWNTITYWFFAYLQKERGYEEGSILFTMVPTILILAAGYPIGGALGDFFFKKSPRGRILVSSVGVLTGAILLTLTMNVPVQNQTLFMVLLGCTALFIPFAGPNVISTVFDVSLPEVRSTAMSTMMFAESAGAALAPLIAGMIADRASLHDAILYISVSTWLLCFLFFLATAYIVPRDIATLRQQMRERAQFEQARQIAAG